MKIAYLEINSWVGISFNAEHIYGKLHIDGETIELERKISKEEADILNRKDAASLGESFFNLKEGDYTIRYNDESELVKDAIKNAIERDVDVLIEGCPVYVEPQKVLYSKTFSMFDANEIFNKFDRLSWDKENEEEEKNFLSKKWFKLTKINS